jgi:hypothetical protein
MMDRASKPKSVLANFVTFTFLFLNIQGLCGKLDVVEDLVLSNSCDFICLSEHWINDDSLHLCRIKGYDLVSSYQRSMFRGGGTLIYASSRIRCEPIDLSDFCTDKHFEVCAVCARDINIVVVSIYITHLTVIQPYF